MTPLHMLLIASFAAAFGWAWWGRGAIGRRRGYRLYSALLDDAEVRRASGEIAGSLDGSRVLIRFAAHREPWASYRAGVADCIEVVLDDAPDSVRLALTHRFPTSIRLDAPASLKTGDSRFDPRFWIDGEPAARVTACLGPEVRAMLLELRFVELALGGGSLLLRYYAFPANAAAARRIVELALKVRENARAK